MLAAFFDTAAIPTEGETRRRQLTDQLENVKRQMALVDELFNLAWDDDLIEACIYQTKAFHAYFHYLYKELRREGEEDSMPLLQAKEVLEPVG
ncbi:MAG TPA: YaaL family protein [Firmicutes bacterium]|nr:YaaL family protein [Bacillota bacterium]